MVSAILMMMFSGVFAQQPISVLPELFHYDSIVSFDVSDNYLEKAIYTYTKRGIPVLMEYYAYTNGAPELKIKTIITDDNGDVFKIRDSLWLDSPISDWIIVQQQYSLDNFGNLITQKVTNPYATYTMGYNIFYGINNRIDSIFVFDQETGLEGTKYRYTYNENDLLIQIELDNEIIDNKKVITKYTYTYNTDNKLEGRVSEIFTYENRVLNTALNRKEILSYDDLERPLRYEIYIWDIIINDYKEQYDIYVIYYYKANTGIINYGKRLDMPVTVATDNGLITINSPFSEKIDIYSMGGSLLCTKQKPSGQTTVFLPSFSHGIYIVRGNSGWTKKIYLR
jgi:hypothetical protein